ncbi:unnamed protein product, partial [Scytosiphon promiscuus]
MLSPGEWGMVERPNDCGLPGTRKWEAPQNQRIATPYRTSYKEQTRRHAACSAGKKSRHARFSAGALLASLAVLLRYFELSRRRRKSRRQSAMLKSHAPSRRVGRNLKRHNNTATKEGAGSDDRTSTAAGAGGPGRTHGTADAPVRVSRSPTPPAVKVSADGAESCSRPHKQPRRGSQDRRLESTAISAPSTIEEADPGSGNGGQRRSGAGAAEGGVAERLEAATKPRIATRGAGAVAGPVRRVKARGHKRAATAPPSSNSGDIEWRVPPRSTKPPTPTPTPTAAASSSKNGGSNSNGSGRGGGRPRKKQASSAVPLALTATRPSSSKTNEGSGSYGTTTTTTTSSRRRESLRNRLAPATAVPAAADAVTAAANGSGGSNSNGSGSGSSGSSKTCSEAGPAEKPPSPPPATTKEEEEEVEEKEGDKLPPCPYPGHENVSWTCRACDGARHHLTSRSAMEPLQRAHGFKVQRVPNDGDCFFSSIEAALSDRVAVDQAKGRAGEGAEG